MKLTITVVAAVFAGVWCLIAASGSAPFAGSYQIRNSKFGELLRPEDANNADGTHIVLHPQQPWKCMTWKLSPAGDSAYYLKNHFTGKTFAGQTNGKVPIVLQVPLASDASMRPTWVLTKLPDGFYRISDQHSGQVLTASSKRAVTLAPWEERSEQKWELLAIDPSKLTM
jgi:hypothetical protein